jgi:uncharacterized BrkB/YihY/UPF0761 family membrane protein
MRQFLSNRAFGLIILSLLPAVLAVFGVGSAFSQAPFYQGKTITLIVADPAFINEYRKLTGGDEPTPLMPDEQAKVVKEIPRDAETIELFKKFAGTGPLPSR